MKVFKWILIAISVFMTCSLLYYLVRVRPLETEDMDSPRDSNTP